MQTNVNYHRDGESASDWLPVEDHLPDDGMIVLVALQNDAVPVWIGSYDYESSCWMTPDNLPFRDHISHWADLPMEP